MKSFKILTVLSLIILFAGFSSAQQFTVNIEQTVKKLPPEKWIELNDLPDKIQRYIDNHQWTDGDIPFNIELNIQILFENVRSTYEEIYTARISLLTSTGFKHSDIRWSFHYLRSDNLQHNNIFEPLTGLLDFYLNIIIGEELDRYSEMGGTKYFNNALDIALQGKLARAPYATWWDRRERFVGEYFKESHRIFRELKFFFYVADYYYDENNKDEVINAIGLIIENLQKLLKIRDEEENVKRFFSMNHKRLAEIFSMQKEKINYLIEIDPDHKTIYEQFLK